MKNKSILVLFMLILPCLAFAQIKFSIYGNYGISKFIEKNNEPTVIIGNYYTSLPSFSIGADALYSFDNSKFGIISGLDFSSFAAENHMPDDFNYPSYTGPKSWDERLYALSLPIKLNFKYEEWAHINVGLSNTFILNEPNEITINKINHYTLNFIGGFEFVIKQRFKIGASYYRDILPTMVCLKGSSNPEAYNINYFVEQFTVKIGFVF